MECSRDCWWIKKETPRIVNYAEIARFLQKYVGDSVEISLCVQINYLMDN